MDKDKSGAKTGIKNRKTKTKLKKGSSRNPQSLTRKKGII
jgi:hypothetical protein